MTVPNLGADMLIQSFQHPDDPPYTVTLLFDPGTRLKPTPWDFKKHPEVFVEAGEVLVTTLSDLWGKHEQQDGRHSARVEIDNNVEKMQALLRRKVQRGF